MYFHPAPPHPAPLPPSSSHTQVSPGQPPSSSHSQVSPGQPPSSSHSQLSPTRLPKTSVTRLSRSIMSQETSFAGLQCSILYTSV